MSTSICANSEKVSHNLAYLDMHKYQKPIAFFEFDVTKEISCCEDFGIIFS